MWRRRGPNTFCDPLFFNTTFTNIDNVTNRSQLLLDVKLFLFDTNPEKLEIFHGVQKSELLRKFSLIFVYL